MYSLPKEVAIRTLRENILFRIWQEVVSSLPTAELRAAPTVRGIEWMYGGEKYEAIIVVLFPLISGRVGSGQETVVNVQVVVTTDSSKYPIVEAGVVIEPLIEGIIEFWNKRTFFLWEFAENNLPVGQMSENFCMTFLQLEETQDPTNDKLLIFSLTYNMIYNRSHLF